ncbi:MAG: ABC transporter substrate-binding protein, partial [Pseudomonadota bacterium]
MKKILICCCLIAVLSSCATGGPRRVQYPNAVTPESQLAFDAARQLYLNHKIVAADSAFASFITDFPYTELTDEAHFLRGEIAFTQNKYSAAVDHYRSSFSQIDSPLVAPKARFKAALALYKMRRYQEALSELKNINRHDASAVLSLRADSLGVYASREANKSRSESIIWYLGLLDDYSEGATKSAATGVPGEKIVPEAEAELFVKEWIEDRSVAAEDVEALSMKEMKGKRSGGFVLYKLALTYHSSGDSAYAKRLLKNFISGYSKHEYYGAARLLMSELGGEVGEAAEIAVGVVLPLSGRYAVYGESVLHGIECAIGLYEPCVGPGGVRLVVRDSASTVGGAPAAVEDIANDKEVVAIIGPLESSQAPAAAKKAQELGMPLISLSQRSGIVEIGDYTFRNSASTQSEISTLVDYAIDKKGWKRFFVIYPENRKGAEYYRLFSNAVKDKGGKVVVSKSYKPRQLQFVSELRGRGAVELATEQAVDLNPQGVSFNAIFIPDSHWVVGSLLQMMTLSGDQKVQLLGISRWNDPELVKRGGEYVEGALFASSFFKEAPDPIVSSFVTSFHQAYNVEPTLLEALGFDTMRMITSAVRERGALHRTSMRDALSRTSNFSGVAGSTTFDELGDAKRRMWILTVQGGRIKAIQ